MVGATCDIVVEAVGDVRRLSVVGELDLATAPVLTGLIVEPAANGTKVEVDLSRVTFIDASGLRALLGAQAGVDGIQGVELVNPSGPVWRLFDLVGVSDRLVPVRHAVSADRQT